MRRLHRHEHGQVIFLYVMVITVFFVVAVLGIDATLWHSQRRTAQKDADAIAFCAGQELFNRTTKADMQSRVTTQSNSCASLNGIDTSYFTNGSPKLLDQCFASASFDGKPDGVQIDVSKQGSSFFSRIWNLVAPDVGAHAKVCIGSPPDAEGVQPFGIPVGTSSCFQPDGTPLFGQTCDIEVRAPAGQSGETGVLRLYNDDSLNCSAQNTGGINQALIQEVAFGAHTTCAIAAAGSNVNNCQILNGDGIGTCIWSDTGNKASVVLQGLQLRLSFEGQTTAPYNCDNLYPDTWFNSNNVQTVNGLPPYNNDHVDQWWEGLFPAGQDIHSVTPGPGVFFEKRGCTATRLVTLILLNQFNPNGQGPYLINGFAGFFITGCTDTSGAFNSRCVDKNCKLPGGGNNPCPKPKPAEPELSNTGQIKMQGMFINFIDVGKRGGGLTKFGRAQLFLVE